MTDMLNEFQRNSLITVLLMCEKRLRRAQAYLSSAPTQGILYQEVLSLPEGQQRYAYQLVIEGLALVAEMARDFNLESTNEDITRAIAAAMNACWSELGDARSARLRAYGAVDPRLGPRLDPKLERLEKLVLSIDTLMRRPKEEPQH